MFNPAEFGGVVKRGRTSILIGNSQHPVMKHVKSEVLRPVPGDPKLWYIVTKKGNVITYRDEDETIQFHDISFKEFRRRVENKINLNSGFEVVDADLSHNKWLGNVILKEIIAYEVNKEHLL